MKKYHLNHYLPDIEKVHLAQWGICLRGLHLELPYLPADSKKPLAYLAGCYYLEGNQDYDDEATETLITKHFTVVLKKKQATELQPCGASRIKFFLDCEAEKDAKKHLIRCTSKTNKRKKNV